MNYFSLAEELGISIAVSKEYKRLKNVESIYMKDNNAKKLVEEFVNIQNLYNKALKQDNIKEAIELRKEIIRLYEKIENNRVIKELNIALDEFLNLKNKVYNIIESYIYIDSRINALSRNCKCNKKCGSCE